jgi:hypothetical protein
MMKICSFYKTILLSLSLILFGCVSKATIPKDELSDASKIVYHFKDRSVPPEHHRSYTIEVARDSSSCVVDSYGDIISSKNNIEPPAFLDGLKVALAANEFERCDKSSHEGCTGGTGESLSIIKNDREIFNESVYHCGGSNYGKLCGSLLDTIKKLLEHVKCK